MSARNVTVWRVTAGKHRAMFYTEYHAEQYRRALELHKPLADVAVTVDKVRLPDDPLTRLAVRP